MDRYLFENLGPEKFQHFCQALLLKEHPNLQCFPVGQPDGGRDGLARGDSEISSPTVVLQVKYKRRDEGESAQWMIDALTLEKPKVERLAANGATRYIMVTNARPTGHEDTGRIDRVQTWMDENLPIPAVCLWRDDLERRLDDADSQLKLAYPSILSGEDTLTMIVAAQIGRDRERITRTLRSFVREQYLKDAEVKFRQTELANSLLTLFVDVPIDVSSFFWDRAGKKAPASVRKNIRKLAFRTDIDTTFASDLSFFVESATANAGDVLLDSELQTGLPWVVLEGAPGQGKSTLAQYVCQVHRAQYLGETEFLSQVSERHAQSAFRLPIKVDLRDLAAFLDGRPIRGEEESPEGPKTLERFLAALVSIKAGGLSFSADDLVETATHVPILLFLDGLDEVADLNLRKVLIERILEGLNRLKDDQSDIQVVVTSRPSLFGSGAEFPKAFTRLSLAPISPETISEYASKWTVAKNLSDEHAAEVKTILHDKLALGHIRELTRNPMQLAILLSLIDSVGYSLPDVRTDLYREYMKLFMTREAEKSAGVKQHRHLLLEIVEYLAWRLQCEAESNGSTGAVNHDELREIVEERLRANQQDTAILDDLFTGGIERVYVLVQRVEGLYEFEVQPLREYFAAKYLYSSAPVSHFRNQIVHGDRAQRFEAIAVNPYWANVTRFYAGFYEPGEIGALSSSLRELVRSRDLAVSISARSIGAALLADWIFRSKKFIQDEVIDLVFDSIGVKLAVASSLPGFVGASLDPECGRQHLAEVIFTDHIAAPGTRITAELCSFLRDNGGERLSKEFKSWVAEAYGPERTARFNVACKCGAFSAAESTGIDTVATSDTPEPMELQLRTQAIVRYAPNLLNEYNSLAEAAVECILGVGGYDTRGETNEIAKLASYLSGPFERSRRNRFSSNHADIRLNIYNRQESVLSVVERLKALRSVPDKGEGLATRMGYQLNAVEDAFGDVWGIYRMALLYAGALKISEGVRGTDPASTDATIMVKALLGRSWRGRNSWWEDRITGTAGHEHLFWIALLLAWSPSKTISKLVPFLDTLIDKLADDDFERLLEVLSHADQIYRVRGLRGRGPVAVLDDSQGRLAHLLLVALGDVQRSHTPLRTGNPRVNELLESYGAIERVKSFRGWKSLSPRQINMWLDFFSHASGESVEFSIVTLRHPYNREFMNFKVAQKVLRNADVHLYPLVGEAYSALQLLYKPASLQQVASDGEWTFD